MNILENHWDGFDLEGFRSDFKMFVDFDAMRAKQRLVNIWMSVLSKLWLRRKKGSNGK